MPSGIVLSLQDVLIEEDAHLARFRYVAPDLESFGFAGVENDFPDLCAKQAVPWVREGHDAIRRVVISMASAPVEFGVASPDVTQFFEMFRIEDSACIWEGL
ncbi:hypothetical protein ATO6_08990 [Oceanicola sp. 22II-s10i]|nr:hypothetical protein ATO6_08990 [Oceanicola sp. 22II-s10i]